MIYYNMYNFFLYNNMYNIYGKKVSILHDCIQPNAFIIISMAVGIHIVIWGDLLVGAS